MNKSAKRPVQIVWFKRDLRLADHLPLVEASQRGAVLPLYVVEPSVIHAPDYDASHWTFTRESLAELNDNLAKIGQPLIIRVGEVLDVLRELQNDFTIEAMWAHEETGNFLTYQRDRAVRRWARENGIKFTEFPNNAVVRRLPTRDIWTKIWEQRMSQAVSDAPAALQSIGEYDAGHLPTHAELGLPADRRTSGQKGGEAEAIRTFDSFLDLRGGNYAKEMSSPVTAWESCSRISPYLTYGNVSLRYLVRGVRAEREKIRAGLRENRGTDGKANWASALRAFESRLHWHCHFIQKLEDEPHIEFENMVRAYDGMRPAEPQTDEQKDVFAAWCAGKTGYPMIDACMRALHETGWINFRMRAMLVSFSSYDLWQHWREPSLYLAKMFLDYEAGIHYSQFQMQSATSGINQIRVYNATKQSLDHDPNGIFLRAWLPELRDVPTEFIHEPHLMPHDVQLKSGCIIGKDYPPPIVDRKARYKEVREQIYAFRRLPETRAEAEAVMEKHGSRKKPNDRKPRRKKKDEATAETSL